MPPAGWHNGGPLTVGRFTADLFVVGPLDGKFANNVNVTTSSGANYVPIAGLPAQFPKMKQALATTYGAQDFTAMTPLTVAGEPAYSFEERMPQGSVLVHDEQLFVDHAGTIVVITLTCTPGSFASLSTGPFQALLASWQWI